MLCKNSFSNVYNFKFESIDGKEISLEKFKGKTVLITNTASFCGYTYQYEQLQYLYNKYSKKGLIIIGIPSNDFGSQEYKTNKEVKNFCETKFNITFLLTSITNIKGEKGHKFFRHVREKFGFLSFPKWNFYKYLITKEGNLHSWYSSVTKPNSEKFINILEKIL